MHEGNKKKRPDEKAGKHGHASHARSADADSTGRQERRPVKSPWDSISPKAAKGGRPAHGKPAQQSFTGKVSAHPDGFGFVDVEGREKGFFLPHEEMNGLMHGDTVEVRPVRKRGRDSAEVVRIVEHAPTMLVGQFLVQGKIAIVQPRSRKMPQSILIAHGDTAGAHDGDWVRVEINRGAGHLRGKVEEVLGDNLSPSRLIDLIVAEQQLEVEFPPAVTAEANRFSDTVLESDNIAGRKDLRHIPFVTIDGEDARDFDDAICVLPRGEGFEAWVSIADVSHYVLPNSALDKEALARSNSFYFPDRVIPMLPEKLSNGLCSLNPDVARLGMTVRMRFDVNGTRRSIHVYESVIHSQARLTYTQAAAWIEHRDEAAVKKPEIRTMLDDAARLFHKLEKKRKQRGALDLDMPEVRALLKDDVVVDIIASDRNIAHRLIEEMMLAANTAVAEYMDTHDCALLYRIHPAPERQAIETLNEFLAPFGLFVKLPKIKGKDKDTEGQQVRPGDVQLVLEQSEGKPFAHVLHRLVLRSMQQAKYTPVNVGHFGLAYDSYAHFTSPIRRYADLIVHRRLKALVRGENPDRVQPVSTLAEIGMQTSIQERKQQRGEWDTQAMLAALFHSKDVGKTMPARIAGLTKRRIFFELEPTLAEGGLNVDDLPGAFELDESGHQLAARRGGAAYHLGDRMDVIIDSTDPVRGQINVRLAGSDPE
ncbi:MAG: ribonuclease R [Zetaproteobacteria bacterium CG12_big_fil_rev_8_21_14_0_65_54_13]|nr:MAG: ribonuclease R [Zetaproteobacteria bacterium CG23_combo_of_CG06-09_8_20_14_all_54_7]PIW50705.1 MAG: ribonuclease R [Zetaproteobacteria bacterium CG12_big_fil_rev_8_21_14_0_65_54_13]PIX55586.1 MAG: ribonuclease R [Zetaproteobacteria bacterium CG_4_10_14_3_um_filter_54_28]PJA27458.1 MAG: ribonuclease R [Zetaproteobacteria bacterium CG_4_9_14_3_um_filter_54_145]